jgi:hypothetical protein
VRPTALALVALAMIAVSFASAYFLFADTSRGSSCTVVAGGDQQCSSYSRTLVEDQGAWVLALLAAPVVLTGIVFWLIATSGDRSLAVGVAVLFLGFCVISIFSIGAFYILGALLLLTAGLLYRRPRESNP